MYYPLIITTAGFSLVFSLYELYRTARSKTTYTALDGIENGAMVGLFFTYLTTPVEMVKCVMQFDVQHKYKNSRHCLRSIINESGIRGIYRGSTIMFLR